MGRATLGAAPDPSSADAGSLLEGADYNGTCGLDRPATHSGERAEEEEGTGDDQHPPQCVHG